MHSNSQMTRPVNHFPDGWDESAIDALIAEVNTEIKAEKDTVPVVTSALVDGSALQRRLRRMERRRLTAVVRALPARPHASESDVETEEVA